MPYFGEMLALGAGLSWAIGVVLFKKSEDQISPIALNLFKNVLATGFLAILLALTHTPLIPELSCPAWIKLFISGVVGISIADTFFFIALKKLGASLTAIVDTTYAPFVLTMSYFILGERIGWPLLLGGALIISAMLVGTLGQTHGNRTRRNVIQGMGIGIVGIAPMSLSIVMIKPLLDSVPALWSASFRVCAGTVGLFPIILLHPHRTRILSVFRPSRSWIYAIPGSFIGTAVAMLLWIGGMKHTQVSRAALLNQLSTIFIFVLAVCFLKEPLTRRRTGAIALAFGGAALVVWGKHWGV
ncbi:MAG: DMT family transporter [Planctomycetes bacterium]|nr:DMT family transporter [Planctomycetota bacterium]